LYSGVMMMTASAARIASANAATSGGNCGSLRKGSFNRALMNALPALAPADRVLETASRRP
jgi:hypothetical protein